MTPEAFTRWASDMETRHPHLYRSDRDLAAALGVHYNAITRYRQQGGKHMLGLACRALTHQMEPYK